MTFLLYIGKNKDFLRKFSKLENVQMIYAQNYQDAITICIRLKVRENIIVLHEQGEMNGDIEQIGAFRKKFYQAYVVLITDRLTPEASKVYLNSGINDTVSLNITTARLRQKIDIINKRQELLYAHNRKKKDVRHFILPPMEALLRYSFLRCSVNLPVPSLSADCHSHTYGKQRTCYLQIQTGRNELYHF